MNTKSNDNRWERDKITHESMRNLFENQTELATNCFFSLYFVCEIKGWRGIGTNAPNAVYKCHKTNHSTVEQWFAIGRHRTCNLERCGSRSVSQRHYMGQGTYSNNAPTLCVHSIDTMQTHRMIYEWFCYKFTNTHESISFVIVTNHFVRMHLRLHACKTRSTMSHSKSHTNRIICVNTLTCVM